MKLQKIIEILEQTVPNDLALEWDNVGLMIGDSEQEINKIIVALDFNSLVLQEAIDKKCDLIITHHPAIFNPLKKISNKNYIKAIKNNISVYSMHTNLDNATGGVNYVLADLLELYNCSQDGMVRYGNVDTQSLECFAEKVKNALNTKIVRVVGDLNKKISKVAVVGGSGGSMVNQVLNLGVDLFVTGECAYNYEQDAYENDLAIITAGHFETENPVVHKLRDILLKRLGVEIIESQSRNIYIVI